MTDTMKLPVGIERFDEIRTMRFYYIDKTKLIEELLENWGKVNLFTRPRRFGKTLNMSMLECFFEIGADKSLFDGLYISKNKELCDAHMGKYPVIFVSLKDVDGLTYEDAFARLKTVMLREAARHAYLKTSDRVSENNRSAFERLVSGDDEAVTEGIRLLSEMLCEHHRRRTVILIDEYDVPLDKAFQHGYYEQVVALIRSLMGQALKTNGSLQFAVLTGCLRVSKESIFTGLNNFKVLSIADARFDEHFGFTDSEVRRILDDYGLSDHFDEMKEWYDGYHFGNADVYCPWDVINHVDLLRANPKAKPQAYWINTSGNELVKRLVSMADGSTKGEIERLIAGEVLDKQVRLELTYSELDDSIDNIWSVLFTTGYLTQIGEVDVDRVFRLVIPNREIREIFVSQIQEWFKKSVIEKESPMKALGTSLEEGRADDVERQLNDILRKTISILDTKARESQKENFYHGFLLGLLQSKPEWAVRSNTEAGESFSDIIIEPEDIDSGIVIEVKYSASFAGLDAACEAAMKQIKDRRYDEYLRNDGRENITAYAIAFFKKRCRVAVCKL